MRKFLLGSVAVAAITVVAEGPANAAPPAAFSWTGCYVGGNIGGGWAHKDFVTGGRGDEGAGTADMHSFVGGGQLGCDVQNGMWVFGVQGMFDWSSMRGADPFFGGKSFSTHIPWFATASGRIGYLAQPTLLIFFTGGAAFVRDQHQFLETNLLAATADVTRTGWLLGGGFEWMFAPYWSVTVQYDYMSFGTKSVAIQGVGGFPSFSEDIRQHAQAVLIGLNYRGSWGPASSDIRLKRDIHLLATLDSGMKIYSFKYLWSDTAYVGVMAQDLLANPAWRDAVVTSPNGFYAVNYSALGLKMTTLEEWQAQGVAAIKRGERLSVTKEPKALQPAAR